MRTFIAYMLLCMLSFVTLSGDSVAAAQPDTDESALTDALPDMSEMTVDELNQVIKNAQAMIAKAEQRLEIIEHSAVTLGDCMDDQKKIGCQDLREVQVADVQAMLNDQAEQETAAVELEKMYAELAEGNDNLLELEKPLAMLAVLPNPEHPEALNLVMEIPGEQWKDGEGPYGYMSKKFAIDKDANHAVLKTGKAMTTGQAYLFVGYAYTNDVNPILANSPAQPNGSWDYTKMWKPKDTEANVIVIVLKSLQKDEAQQVTALLEAAHGPPDEDTA